jgi:hypothetical protein
MSQSGHYNSGLNGTGKYVNYLSDTLLEMI